MALRVSGKQNNGAYVTTSGTGVFAIVADGESVRRSLPPPTGIRRRSGRLDGATAISAGVHGRSSSLSGADIGRDRVGAEPGWERASRGIAEASSGTTYGVFGQTSSPDWLRSSTPTGDAHVNGTLSKSAGSFKIDHPLDPANKYLSHSFVESPDMLNVYSGTAVTGRDGEATVELPDWFDALNRDVRYQLTAVGSAAPDLHVKTKVERGRFSIAGGRGGQEVSWQLTGIRQDAYAKEHPIVVEQVKTGAEKGKYLHPELFGKPASSGLHRVAHAPKPPQVPTLSSLD